MTNNRIKFTITETEDEESTWNNYETDIQAFTKHSRILKSTWDLANKAEGRNETKATCTFI